MATRILGLSSDATIDEIKKAYRILAKKYHPDQNSDADANSNFIDIKTAYNYLINNMDTNSNNTNNTNSNQKTYENNTNNTYDDKNNNHDIFKKQFNFNFNLKSFLKKSIIYISISFVLSIIIIAILHKPTFLIISRAIYTIIHRLEQGYIILLVSLFYILFNLNDFRFSRLVIVNIVAFVILIILKILILDLLDFIKFII